MPTTPITNALITVQEAFGYLKQTYIATDPEYDLCQQIINGITTTVNNELGRPVVAETYTKKLRGDGTKSLQLDMYPVHSVTSLKVITDWNRTTELTLVEDTDYFLEGDEGVIELDSYRGQISSFPKIPKCINISYKAGVAADNTKIPSDIKLAAMILLQFYWQSDIAAFSTTFQDSVVIKPEAWPSRVKKILSNYKRPPSIGGV